MLNASIVQGKGTMTEFNSFDRFEKTFDIEDPAFAEQFEDVLEHLITKCPVAHSEVGPGYHVFNRYRTCDAAQRTGAPSAARTAGC